MSRRRWNSIGGTLGTKAFRFGIFWTESGPLKPCHCAVLQRKSAGSGPSDPCMATKAVCRCCLADQALVRSKAVARSVTKAFPYYDTNFGASFVLAGANAAPPHSSVG